MIRCHRSLALLALLLLLLGTAPAPARAAQAAPPWPGALIPHGWSGGGPIDITVPGASAYLLQGLRLVILDVSDPDLPRRAGELQLARPPRGLAAAEGFVYVLDDTGVQIVDARDPASPALAGSYAATRGYSSYTSLMVVAGYLYVSGSEPRGIHVVDVRDPAHPQRTAVVALPAAARVIKASGQLAYVTTEGPEARLLVLDVSDPAAPSVRGSVAIDSYTTDLTVAGSTVLVCAYDRLLMFSVANPAAPAPAGQLPLEGRPSAIVRDGSRAYVTADLGLSEGALLTLDVQTPTAPRVLGSLPLPGIRTRVPVRGGVAYISSGVVEPGSLLLVDLSDPAAPVSRGRSDTLSNFREVVGHGSLLLAVAEGVGHDVLWTLEPRADGRPVPRGRLALAGFAGGMGQSGILDTDGLFAYVATTRVLTETASYETVFQVIDLADPAAPAARGSLGLPGTASDIHLAGQLVYAGIDNRLAIIDVSQPDRPALLASQIAPARVGAVTGTSTRAYVLSSSLLIYDVSTPTSLTLLGSAKADQGVENNTLILDGDYLYHALADMSSAGRYGDVFSYDVSDPSAPQLLDNLYKPNPSFSYQVFGALLRPGYLIASTSQGLLMVDIRNPAQLQIQSAYWGLPGRAGFALAGQQLHINYGGNGLATYTLLDPRIWLPQARR